MFKLGIVIQYFPKTAAALIKLNDTLTVGEKIKIFNGNTEIFEQVVDSIQIGHTKLGSADRDSMVVLRVNEKVEKGWEIFKESRMG